MKSQDQKTSAEREAERKALVEHVLSQQRPDGINSKGNLFKGSLTAMSDPKLNRPSKIRSSGTIKDSATRTQTGKAYIDIIDALEHRKPKKERKYPHLKNIMRNGTLGHWPTSPGTVEPGIKPKRGV